MKALNQNQIIIDNLYWISYSIGENFQYFD
jgi:hypothetical protein